MRTPTTSRRSSSANRPARAGSRSCTARSCTIWCARSGNISVHVIAGEELAGEPIPKKTRAHGRKRRAVRSASLCRRAAGGCRGARRRSAHSAVARDRERRPGLPDRRGRRRRALWACGRRCSRAVAASLCYNFFFLPPIYTFTIADPTNVAAFVFFTIVAVRRLAMLPRACRTQAVAAHGTRARRRNRSTPSAASSPASARSTTSFGPRPTRPP